MITHGEAGAQSAAQGVPNAVQGFSQNRDQPIQIEAATLEMRDKKKEATFSGNVKVVQGDTTMTSKVLVVFYDSATVPASTPTDNSRRAVKSAPPIQSATPGPGGSSSIRRLEAKGGVVVTQKDQVVTGQAAVFDTRTNLINHAWRGGADSMQECRARRSLVGGHDHRRFAGRIGQRKGPGPGEPIGTGLRLAVTRSGDPRDSDYGTVASAGRLK